MTHPDACSHLRAQLCGLETHTCDRQGCGIVGPKGGLEQGWHVGEGRPAHAHEGASPALHDGVPQEENVQARLRIPLCNLLDL